MTSEYIKGLAGRGGREGRAPHPLPWGDTEYSTTTERGIPREKD